MVPQLYQHLLGMTTDRLGTCLISLGESPQAQVPARPCLGESPQTLGIEPSARLEGIGFGRDQSLTGGNRIWPGPKFDWRESDLAALVTFCDILVTFRDIS